MIEDYSTWEPHDIKLERPKCRRWGGPLDIMYDPETEHVEWCCNPKPMANDSLFESQWMNLAKQDAVRLAQEIHLKEENNEAAPKEGAS